MRRRSRPVIVFGTNGFATAFAELLREEGDLVPVAFSVDRAHASIATHAGLPVVPMDVLADRFAPHRHLAFAPLGYRGMMALRADVCVRLETLGFTLGTWISQRASVWSGLEPGPNTIVLPNASILPYASLGRDVTVRANVVVSHHCRIDDHVTIANGVVLGGQTRIGTRSWLGLGAVVRDDRTLAPRTFVGAGAVVVTDTEEDGVYVGVPARRMPGTSATAFTSS
jgi:sugar O-acyltransferase (sialic acid O-acetyltransferase NeuD family)